MFTPRLVLGLFFCTFHPATRSESASGCGHNEDTSKLAQLLSTMENKLTEISLKMDNMERKVNAIETSSQCSDGTSNNQRVAAGMEEKIEQYGKKILDQQNVMRNEARDNSAVTKSFRGVLENGIHKIYTKLNSQNAKNNEEEENEILGAIEQVKEAVNKCTDSSSDTRTRLDDMFTDLLVEWTTAHRQMRQIDNKLTKIQNASTPESNTDELRIAAAQIQRDYKALEELELKVIHAVRVSTDLQHTAVSKEDRKAIEILSRNLLGTLKGIQGSLEESIKSLRDNVELMDEFLGDSRNAKRISTKYLQKNTLEEIITNLNKNVDRKLEEIGDQTRTFLSTEAFAKLTALREELQQKFPLMSREYESQNKWRMEVQSGLNRVQDAIIRAGQQLRICAEQSNNGNLRDKITRRLRDAHMHRKPPERGRD